jgi:outer membrane protein OmpA-like peptidoglycan-associated protein
MLMSDLRAWRACIAMSAIALTAACATPPAAPPPPSAALTKITTLKTLGFVPANDEWELSLGVKLLFESDVSTLSSEGRAAVSEVAAGLVKIGITHVRIEGHTDNVGSRKYNVQLSERRAESVAKWINQAGLRESAIERKGYGADKPVADNSSPAGRAQNRRVVIAVQVE